jgi:stage V sporulation protein S
MGIIKVAANSRTAAVAGAIAGTYREHGFADVQAIGAGAVNQAVKAVLIAKGYLADEDKYIMFVPSMVEVEIEGAVRTAIRLAVKNNDGYTPNS